MGNLTFSKLQKKQYNEIKNRFSETEGMIYLSDEDDIRMKEVLVFLEIKGYIRSFEIDGIKAYRRMSDFKSFDDWHKDQEREERKMSAREWKIAIVSAVVGAAVGLIPFFASTVIPWAITLFENNYGGL